MFHVKQIPFKTQKDAQISAPFRKGLDKEMGMSGLGLRPKWKVSLCYADFSARSICDLGIRIVYSIKFSVSVLTDCASIPDNRIVSIALLMEFRKIRKSFITALLFPRCFSGLGMFCV